MDKNRVLYNGRKTIAVFSGSMSSAYHEGIVRGVSSVAEERGYNVVIFAGGPLKSPDPLSLSRDTLFDLLDPELFDGLIIPVSSHTRFLTIKERDEFINRYNSIPIINIGSRLPGFTNINYDYEKGIEEILDHYINFHGYRRIALIRGPKNHNNSDLRESIYKKILEKNNIPYSKKLVFHADLNRLAVKHEVDDLFDSNGKLICDAILTNNDNQALGLLEELTARGVNVPEDVAICGSINNLDGLFSKPALNTIEEPKLEIGRAAALALIDMIEGEKSRGDINIPTKLILRDSCGCQMTGKVNPKKYQKYPITSGNETSDLVEELCINCKTLYKENRYALNNLSSLIEYYKHGLLSGDFKDFFTHLRIHLHNYNKNEDITFWLNILSEFEYCSCMYLERKGQNSAVLECITSLMSIKESIVQKAILFQSYETDYYISHFREISNNLNSSFDLNSVKNYAMDLLDLTDLYISIYNFKNDKIESIKNVISVKDSIRLEIPIDDKFHKPVELLPQVIDNYSERYTMIVFPLSFRKKPLGYIMHNLSNRKGSAYENMQSIISTAIKNELQIEDLKKAEKRFSDIAHSTSNWLWESDKEYNFTYSSYSVSEVLGYSDIEILEMRLSDLSLPSSKTHLEIMNNHQQVKNMEVWFYHRNGSIKCLLMSAKPISNNDGFFGYRGVFKDITEQKLQEEKINNLAYTDVLTGLPNRAKFQDELERVLVQAKNNDNKFALMFIDLDRFKYVNDTLGHDAGDRLLQQVSKRILSATRSNDIVSRLGGDEFTIILPLIKDANQVDLIAKRILNRLEKPIVINNQPIHATLSLGVSIYPNDGLDSVSLLKKSDNAMYQAKSHGRNRYTFYDVTLEEENLRRYTMEHTLRNALGRREFILLYQPQVDVTTGKIAGVEALVRIDSKTDGLISPNNFIPLAEELGLIGQIDLQVLDLACRQHIKWIQDGYGRVRISLNLSALQLKNDDVVNEYMTIVKRYGVVPKYLKFELTEYSIIDNEIKAFKILNEFKDAGFTIALDDFGTGFSSLSCINKYPIDTIKIDRSFVINAVNSKKNSAVIKAIITLAQTLGMGTVAEGVETEEQYNLITSLGCSEIQGYYFYRPLSHSDLEALLSQ